MTSLLFGIIVSALLSVTSLLIVIFRVSPLTAPTQAIPAFIVSVFLSVSSVGALLFFGLWHVVRIHTWDIGKLLTISVRQGVLLGAGTVGVIVFHILGILTWWIAVLLYAVFVLIELAMNA